MKKTIVTLALIGFALGFVSAPVFSQGKDDSQVTVKGSIAAGVQVVGETERSSKFTEYRDVPRGFFLEYMNVSLTKGSHFFTLSGMNVQQADERIKASFGDYGKFKLDVG